MTGAAARELLDAIKSASPPDHARLFALPGHEQAALVSALLDDAAGRRWLRMLPELPPAVADQLLAHEEDFRATRRDRTLDAVVATASLDALLTHAAAVAAGPAAPALWSRLAAQPQTLTTTAATLASADDAQAAETTLALLVLDPLDPWGIGAAGRALIASAGLRSPAAHVRGLAAEFLATVAPSELLNVQDTLVRDEDQRVRGLAWDVAFQQDRALAVDAALALLSGEDEPVEQRRSALMALGTHLPTSDLIDLLAWAVMHPQPEIAGDAAALLHELHRNPIVAEAALRSPHEHVRETAEWLMDPLRGSPAAGGSRPGDPTRGGDVFEEMIRRLEEMEQRRQAQPPEG